MKRSFCRFCNGNILRDWCIDSHRIIKIVGVIVYLSYRYMTEISQEIWPLNIEYTLTFLWIHSPSLKATLLFRSDLFPKIIILLISEIWRNSWWAILSKRIANLKKTNLTILLLWFESKNAKLYKKIFTTEYECSPGREF